MAPHASAQFHDVQAEFLSLDTDGDGVVSRDEFLARGRKIVGAKGDADEKEIAEKLKRYEQRFEAADIDNDGSLTMREAEYMAYLLEEARKAVARGVNTPDPEVVEIFNEVDGNGDGQVSEAELLSMLTGDGEDELDANSLGLVSESFSVADLDGSGGLDKDELQFAAWRLQRLISAGEELQRQLLVTFLHFWDKDGDGKIEKQELDAIAKALASEDGQVAPVALDWAREHFATYDEDGDGAWNQEEAAAFAGYVIQHREGIV